jgi:hypothetical protein
VLEAQQLILATWVVVAAVCVGFGLLERRFFGPPVDRTDDLFTSFWMGWALLLASLQVWHIFLPVDDRARIAAVAVGALGCLAGGAGLVRASLRQWPRMLAALALFAPAAWILSRLSMLGPRFGDVGMYLIPQVHWFESYASVPGLANVHIPLGHNLSCFLYVALLDGGPVAGKVYHTTISALFAALVARAAVAIVRLVSCRERNTPAELFYALALLPLAELAYDGFNLTSIMPDTVVALFGIVLAGELIALVSAPQPALAGMLRLVFLSAVGLTIKLSLGGFAVTTGFVAWLWWAWKSREGAGAATRGLVLAAAVAAVPLVPWMIRNAITSGYPLYPAPLFPLDVDWISRVDATAWIQKPMSMVPLHTIFTMWDWWQTRLVSLGWTGAEATRPLALIAAGAGLWLLVRPLERLRGHRSGLSLIVVLAPLASALFSFANTPMPRYQGSALWVVGLELVVIALAGVAARHPRVLGSAMAAAAIAAASVPALRTEPWPAGITDFQTAPAGRVRELTLASGLVVRIPEHQQCWYAALPCTPEPHPGLKLREPGNLGAGFRIDPEDADLPVPTLDR